MQVSVGWWWLAFPPSLTWLKVNSVWLMALSTSEPLISVGTR